MITFNALIPFEISAKLFSSDLKTLIGVDLSAWTAAFDPSLLSDPPRVFNSSRAPTLNTGRPGITFASSFESDRERERQRREEKTRERKRERVLKKRPESERERERERAYALEALRKDQRVKRARATKA